LRGSSTPRRTCRSGRAHARRRALEARLTYAVSAETPVIRNFRPMRTAARTGGRRRRARVVCSAPSAADSSRADAVGRAVHIDGIPFTVIGVSEPKDEQIVYIGRRRRVAMIPITTAQRRFVRKDVCRRSSSCHAPARGLDAPRRPRAPRFHHGFRAATTARSATSTSSSYASCAAALLGVRLFLTRRV